MKKTALVIFMFSLAAALPAAAPAESEGGGGHQERHEGGERPHARPADGQRPAQPGQLALPLGAPPAAAPARTPESLQAENAYVWALWDLLKELALARKTGRAVPASFAETCLRLKMRSTVAGLCAGSGPCKVYPSDADFAKAAQYAQKDIAAYSPELKAANPLLRQHRVRVENFLDTALRRVIFPLPTGKDRDPQPVKTAAEENKYLKLALEKKQGEKFALPPWP